ncbi:hypothetical protein BD770DRAFT_409887 [Pilaira anomala]|nr:hypothetical protein BD770DRAFT_409887 [Pilaira anomala]
MVLISSIIASTLLFAHGIHSYCVGNKFKDLTTFSVSKQHAGDISRPDLVWLNMQAGSKMCCPIEDSQCIPDKTGDSIVFYWIGLHHDSALKTARCTSGGILNLGGTKENMYVECIDMHGKSNMYELKDVTQYDSYTFQDTTAWRYEEPETL